MNLSEDLLSLGPRAGTDETYPRQEENGPYVGLLDSLGYFSSVLSGSLSRD
jgi:hypothetical protein